MLEVSHGLPQQAQRCAAPVAPACGERRGQCPGPVQRALRTAWAAAGTLVTGFVVLIGAAAAGDRARIYDSAILKTIGATRRRILASVALRSALMGGAAGVVAVVAGGIAGWSVMTFVMDSTYRFEPVSAIGIVLGGVLATLIAGLLFALRPLAARPARTLRAQD